MPTSVRKYNFSEPFDGRMAYHYIGVCVNGERECQNSDGSLARDTERQGARCGKACCRIRQSPLRRFGLKAICHVEWQIGDVGIRVNVRHNCPFRGRLGVYRMSSPVCQCCLSPYRQSLEADLSRYRQSPKWHLSRYRQYVRVFKPHKSRNVVVCKPQLSTIFVVCRQQGKMRSDLCSFARIGGFW